MDSLHFQLPRSVRRDHVIAGIAKRLASLPMEQAFDVEVKERKPRRSLPQNKFLWAIYGYIIKVGGEAMRGWTTDDLHTFFLGEHFGWEEKRIFGRRKMVPVRRSSRLNKQEFTDYVDGIASFMASQGVYVPTPEDDWEAVLAEQVAA